MNPKKHMSLIKEGAGEFPQIIERGFAERKGPSAKQVALCELLGAAFAGEKLDPALLKTLQEGQKPPREKAKSQGRPSRGSAQQEFVLAEAEVIPGFHLPDSLVEAENYVDRLIAGGICEYQVWKNCQAAFAQR